MLTSLMLDAVLAVVALGTQLKYVQAVAPAPAPGAVLVSDAAAAEAYPISTQEALPLTDSATIPVTCNITLIGAPASSTSDVSAAGRRLQAATNTSRGLQTADIHCVGSYNVTIIGGPALQSFASGWTGKQQRTSVARKVDIGHNLPAETLSINKEEAKSLACFLPCYCQSWSSEFL